MAEAPTRKRTNFNKMNHLDFIDYLNNNAVPYTEKQHALETEIIPDHFRLKPRRFATPKEVLSDDIKRIIKLIDDRISQMSTKGVYHPKRIKPKWNALEHTQDKLNYFVKMVSNKQSSIGFYKLVNVNLCHKTLEAIIIENPSFIDFLNNNRLHQICVDKFSKYENGRAYLLNKGIRLE